MLPTIIIIGLRWFYFTCHVGSVFSYMKNVIFPLLQAQSCIFALGLGEGGGEVASNMYLQTTADDIMILVFLCFLLVVRLGFTVAVQLLNDLFSFWGLFLADTVIPYVYRDY
jgi:hypothetical protein